ncbi:protein ATP6V1FNB [Acomys russatus]|uniref:protein ATP6V1FNB n=1 Tax=Acomys russatus TaxID=60746 RepID=UPI0021E2E7D0|nr:protein ATP6V1FNB [Acomys russatus]
MRELFNDRNQAFLGEQIKKEVLARTTWTLRYGHKYLKEGSRARKQPRPAAPFGSVLKASPVASTGSPVRKEPQEGWPKTRGVQDQHFTAGGAQGSRARQARDAPEHAASQGRPENLKMKQPAPATLKLLFQGISHDGQGRQGYLKERYRLKPEEKFKYPMVSSWEYGWHVGDVMKDFRTPAHARMHPITKSFYLKNGLFYIPRRSDDLM